MNESDYRIFLKIVELIKEQKLDRLSQICFITGVMAGLNSDIDGIREYLLQLPEIMSYKTDTEIDALIDEIEEFNN